MSQIDWSVCSDSPDLWVAFRTNTYTHAHARAHTIVDTHTRKCTHTHMLLVFFRKCAFTDISKYTSKDCIRLEVRARRNETVQTMQRFKWIRQIYYEKLSRSEENFCHLFLSAMFTCSFSVNMQQVTIPPELTRLSNIKL